MTDLDIWTALLGAVMPPVVATVVQWHWPAWAKAVVALATSAVAGTLTSVFSGQFAGTTPLRCALFALAASQTAYRLWWHPSGITDRVERATTIRPPT